jgi:23S rRNA (uracil1939-C5)-methyltransferase
MKIASEIEAGDIVELFIEKLLYGGLGLSHYGSIACFVNDVIPGETVLASIDAIKKHYLKTSLQHIVIPSPHRIEPHCRLFSHCGGCQLQHMDYRMQLECKSMIVKECFERIGAIRNPPLLPICPSPATFHYRSRANFKIHANTSCTIGYYQRSTHTIIPVPECPLLVPPLNQALEQIRSLLNTASFPIKNISELQLLFIKAAGEVLVSFYSEAILTACAVITKDTRLQWITIHDSTCLSAGELMLDEEILAMSFKRGPTTFYQVNINQNITMIQQVVNFLKPVQNKRILDLYCGCGNFSLFLAREGAQIIGIDSNKCAIDEAIQNARANNLPDCVYIQGNVESVTDYLKIGQCDAVLINPPRLGCSQKVLDIVTGLQPRTIIYISCNPSTLARDVKQLITSGYAADSIQPVDMFPQTFHIETVIKLFKR